MADLKFSARPCSIRHLADWHVSHINPRSGTHRRNSSRFVTGDLWRHQMGPFSALLALCAGNSPVTGEFPAQRPVTRGFDVFFNLCLNKRLNKQLWGWWFETPSPPLWRDCNVSVHFLYSGASHSISFHITIQWLWECFVILIYFLQVQLSEIGYLLCNLAENSR